MKHRPEEYKAIKAWGERLRSQTYYIKAQQEKAAKDEAPLTAVYYNPDEDRWATLSECTEATQRDIEQLLEVK